MRIVALICVLTIATATLVVAVVLSAPEWILPAIVGSSLIAGAAFRMLLARIAAHWPRRRSFLLAAFPLPVLLWLIAFGVDVAGYIEHLSHPDEGFMIGVSIILFPVCAIGCLAGAIAAFAVGSVANSSRQLFSAPGKPLASQRVT